MVTDRSGWRWAALGAFIVSLFWLLTIDTGDFMRINDLHVNKDGIVVLNREPIFRDMIVDYREEVVSPSGLTCPSVDRGEDAITGTAVYEDRDAGGPQRSVTKWDISGWAGPCLEVGATYRVTYDWGILPSKTYTRLVN